MTLTQPNIRSESQWQPNSINGNKAKMTTKTEPVAEQIEQLKAMLANLEHQVKFARGTEDGVSTPTIPQAVEPKPLSLEDKIVMVLKTNICTTDELAKKIGAPLPAVQAWIKSNRKLVADVGTADTARWVYRIGDDASAQDLQAMVQMLITHLPMTTAELTKVTGARMPRVNGVLVEIQRDPDIQIWNEGQDHRYRWHILPAHAKRVNLTPKAPKK